MSRSRQERAAWALGIFQACHDAVVNDQHYSGLPPELALQVAGEVARIYVADEQGEELAKAIRGFMP